MEIGLPEAIKLTVADWMYIQELDYEQLPFKCRYCHGYGILPRIVKKKGEKEEEIAKDNQWIPAHKPKAAKQTNRAKGKGKSSGNEALASERFKGKGAPVHQEWKHL